LKGSAGSLTILVMLVRVEGKWRGLLASRRSSGFSVATTLWAIVIAFWAAAVGTGTVLLWKYKSTPGVAASPPGTWPADSGVTHSKHRATIVMLAHPRCPCSRASVGELAVLMARLGQRAAAYVLFLIPPGLPDGWEQTELWRSAAAIPGVTVLADRGGVEAQRFRASTSGQTVVYDAAGRLRFKGGLTDARGHFGDSTGLERIVSIIDADGHASESSGNARTRGAVTPVFGCELHDDPKEGK
jgi:hypothetical protein